MLGPLLQEGKEQNIHWEKRHPATTGNSPGRRKHPHSMKHQTRKLSPIQKRRKVEIETQGCVPLTDQVAPFIVRFSHQLQKGHHHRIVRLGWEFKCEKTQEKTVSFLTHIVQENTTRHCLWSSQTRHIRRHNGQNFLRKDLVECPSSQLRECQKLGKIRVEDGFVNGDKLHRLLQRENNLVGLAVATGR